MPFQLPPRLWPVLVSMLAASVMFTVAGCSHLTPLGPDPAATMPQAHQLRSPIVLQAMRVQYTAPSGGCPAGFSKLSAPGQSPGCYRPLGAPVTITSAAVAPGPVAVPVSPPNAPPREYTLLVFLSAAGQAELTGVTTQAYDSQGAVDISVAGKTWGLPMQQAPITHGQFEIALPSKDDLLQLQRILTASG